MRGITTLLRNILEYPGTLRAVFAIFKTRRKHQQCRLSLLPLSIRELGPRHAYFRRREQKHTTLGRALLHQPFASARLLHTMCYILRRLFLSPFCPWPRVAGPRVRGEMRWRHSPRHAGPHRCYRLSMRVPSEHKIRSTAPCFYDIALSLSRNALAWLRIFACRV